MTTNPNIAKIGMEGNPRPPEGQRFIGPLVYDFSKRNPFEEDFRSQMENLSLMSFAMSAYIDSGTNPNYVRMVMDGGQILAVQGFSQGWYPLVSQRPIRYRISSTVAGGTTTLFLANFHIPAFQWSTK